MQTVVTHSGSFDPDDVLASAAIELYLGKGNVQIIRSRQQSVIDKADWVIDVGGKYDPKTRRFDHHQNGVPKRDNGVPYSSFGLVWREIGEELCGSVELADQLERLLVQPIDAADNNVAVCLPGHPDITSFEFFDVINTFKPVWGSDEDFDTGFKRASAFSRRLLKRMIARGHGEILMRNIIAEQWKVSENKDLLVFDRPIPRDAVTVCSGVKMFVSPVFATDVPNWMAVAVPEFDRSLSNRASFPAAWAGLSDKELEKVSDIKGAVFCHNERYIFVAKTKEAALEAASQVITC